MRPWHLERRLTLAAVICTAFFWTASSFVVVQIVEHELSEVFNSTLQETAQRIAVLADLAVRVDRVPDDPETHGIQEHEEYLIYQVRGKDGRVLLKSHDAPEEPFPLPSTNGVNRTGDFWVHTEHVDDLIVQVADSESHRVEALYGVIAGLLLPAAVLLPLLWGASYILTRKALRPIWRLSAQIGSRGVGDFSPLRDDGLPVELLSIPKNVNRFLSRIERNLALEHEFTANSAHEMRTPVAAARAQAQVLEQELKGKAESERASQLVATLARLSRVIERVLQLSRAEIHDAVPLNTVELKGLLRLVMDDYRHRPHKPAFNLDAPSGPVQVKGDMDAIGIVLQNVFDNALTHGDGQIDIQLNTQGELRIANGGVTLTAEELSAVQRRFQRGKTRAPGSGIGLSIVQAMMTQMKGQATFASPGQGRKSGFEATLRFQGAGA